jgi:hypothetical protein
MHVRETVVWLFVVIIAPGRPVQSSEEPQSKPQDEEPIVGYVFCPDPQTEGFASMLLDVCQKLPAGRISCGQRISILQRRGDWLELAFADKRPRYLPLNLVSQIPISLFPSIPIQALQTQAR